MKVSLRPWTLDDAVFVCYLRNDPALMRWFRQSTPLKLKAQRKFIEADIKFRNYNGYVVEADGKPVGVCAVKSTQEFSIGIDPAFQKKGIATKAMQILIKNHPQMWSEVFCDNPALSWYLHKLGFKLTCVKERAYYKPNVGLVDVVRIEHE